MWTPLLGAGAGSGAVCAKLAMASAKTMNRGFRCFILLVLLLNFLEQAVSERACNTSGQR
jgi:hypothetical protein